MMSPDFNQQLVNDRHAEFRGGLSSADAATPPGPCRGQPAPLRRAGSAPPDACLARLRRALSGPGAAPP